ncbi:GDP-mannose 4,6-dehydratase [Candidatus Daviesbacteria bacterium]|nr:GDP-mannose 4,6-dehydratase [Candidatus Daviesbacteria bacterium]
MKKIIITGGAGFIGSNLIDSLLKDNPSIQITCIDNFDSFYGKDIKMRNIKRHLRNPRFKLIEGDILDIDTIKKLYSAIKNNLDKKIDAIVHLAAKVGVRPSVENPGIYTQVNIVGTQNMLELARQLQCEKFIFASSSSVYGLNSNFPWKEEDRLLLPASPYALSKISGELLGSVYSRLFGIQFIALRLFTVYGPRQRPDLAIHKFTKLILQGKPIHLFGNGESLRDYTYIDDIVRGFKAALNYSSSKYEIINLGNNKPIKLIELISLLEKVIKKKAIIKKRPNQAGDVPLTFADISKAQKLLGYLPKNNVKAGLQRFFNWFKKQNIQL